MFLTLAARRARAQLRVLHTFFAMHPRLSEVAQYVETQRSMLLAAADALAAPRWTARPAEGQWSVSEVLEHLHRVERGSARLVAMRANEARAAGHPSELEDGSMLECLSFARLTDRSTRVTSPDRVRPEGGWTRAAALAAIEGSRTELRAAFVAADGLALGSIRSPHPRLGEIDLYQWIMFIGQHEARHAMQVTEIVGAVRTA